jgi:pilus assembly protein TadC
MVEHQEKEELLSEFHKNVNSDMNISFNWFLCAIGIFISILILVVPKIYIKNNLYYESKKFNKYYSQYLALKEENNILRQQLEDIKFRNQILDYVH